ncbi:MAG: hypothetical protein DRO14_00415 [Thermoprotei archaeon]|nr:MAG: hypothetical protein DRO14_00020 [Thermoprotei archaeon]RLG78612.1 MAG: hypothetical protein DRO14_00415 [Thermoprotei archaeon]
MDDELYEEIMLMIEKAWGRNFDNAKRFFRSKGKVSTLEKYKRKWRKEFVEDIIEIIDKVELG